MNRDICRLHAADVLSRDALSMALSTAIEASGHPNENEVVLHLLLSLASFSSVCRQRVQVFTKGLWTSRFLHTMLASKFFARPPPGVS